jgi:hypothetical protein
VASLPDLPNLRACVTGAGSLAMAQDVADCEISFGAVSASGWIIERSTLPFREGRRLFPESRPDFDRLDSLDQDAAGRESVRRWMVTAIEGEVT